MTVHGLRQYVTCPTQDSMLFFWYGRYKMIIFHGWPFNYLPLACAVYKMKSLIHSVNQIYNCGPPWISITEGSEFKGIAECFSWHDEGLHSEGQPICAWHNCVINLWNKVFSCAVKGVWFSVVGYEVVRGLGVQDHISCARICSLASHDWWLWLRYWGGGVSNHIHIVYRQERFFWYHNW